ncbi:MAG: MMPL family transporter [Acidobacteria bacterium]|nr:MMPL family transporter [Acidobacteriota bacterium]
MSATGGPDPQSGHKQRLLLAIESLSRRRWGVVLAMFAAIFVLSTWLGSRIRLESDVLRLIPHGNRQVDTFRQALADFGSIDYLMVLLEAAEPDQAEVLEEFSDLLAARLADRAGLVESVEYRLRPDPRFLELFYDNALLFLGPEDLPAIAAKLTDEAIVVQVADDRAAIATPVGAFREEFLERDPLSLMPILAGRLLGQHGSLKLDLSTGYYLSNDGRSLIMLVKPSRASQDIAFSTKLLRAAREDVDATREELELAAGAPSNVTVRLGGNPSMLVEEAALLRQTILVTGSASFVAVLSLYLICYRRLAALFYSSIPLMVGQAATFAIAYFYPGSLNSASAALPALLMGLGTDFTIVMYARYVEERRAGRDLAQATEAMVGEGGLGVFTGAVTSAGTFYALCISSYRGLSDLGFLIGTGIVLCGIAIIFLLPAMIVWNEGVRKRRAPVKRLHLQSFGLEHLMTASARHRGMVVAGVTVLGLAAAWGATRLDFNESIDSLRSTESASFKTQQDIATRFGASLSYMMAICEGSDLDEAVALAAKVEKRLQPFVANGVVGRYESIFSYLPPAEQQREVLAALAAGSGEAFDPDRVRRTLAAALAGNGFRVEPFEPYLARLDRFLAPERPLTVADLEGKGLDRIVNRYVRRDAGQVRVVTYLYPTRPEWRRTPPPGLVEALSLDDRGITVTGTNVLGRELKRIFLRDAWRAAFLGLTLVAVLLLVDFRSPRLAGIAFAQLVVGVVLMLGCMRLLDMQINYANAFVATMIMGVGIDYSIHLIHRLHLNGGRVDEGVLETGKGVVLATATNIAGFGMLTLADYPALRSLGVMALIGSITCLLTALTLVPALMARRSE